MRAAQLMFLVAAVLGCESFPAPVPDPMDKSRCAVSDQGSASASFGAHVSCLCLQAEEEGSRGGWDFYDCTDRMGREFAATTK